MSITLIIIISLVLGVIFVNGWTDAPNAIATAVSTRVLPPRLAVILAAIFNLLGALIMTWFSAEVAETIGTMVSFDFGTKSQQLAVLAGGLFSIVLWATAAWIFGIPTSESHALIAGITGAALALGGISSINMQQWSKVLWGLVISSGLGLGSGFLAAKFIQWAFKNVHRKISNKIFTYGQAGGAAAMAFMHGAQDGQKFMGVFMLGLYMNGLTAMTPSNSFKIDIWVILLCSLVMGIGTSVGGYRIIKSVGMDMVKLEKYQGFAADIAAAGVLLLSTVFGIPVSTTHTKTTAIMGVGTARRASAVNWRVVIEMGMAWVLTFPCCGLIGYLTGKLFLKIF
ncbi:MAG: Low-affinity inorganic phosphate transporter 1 [Firmicutes bacterium ADurb.Bin182]|nr:MAG: Low-affinity inorganic phosphate transporter 1 [Firmicutes bacterium ADurb.Bin182]